MGATYGNLTLRGVSQAAVVDALRRARRRQTYVTVERQGCVVVYDPAFDAQQLETVSELSQRLSAGLRCTALAVLVFDDDILWYQLYTEGALCDTYNSCPDYFEMVPTRLEPVGGDAEALADAFGAGDVAALERILRASSLSGDDPAYTFETERHAALAAALGLPEWAAGIGHVEVDGGDPLHRLRNADVVRVSPRPAGRRGKRAKKPSKDSAFVEEMVRTFVSQNRMATAIGEAARWGRLDLVKDLLASGVPVDASEEPTNSTALALAASGGHADVVEYLIAAGADVNARGWRGATPLMSCIAAMHSTAVYLAVARLLLEAGAWRSLDARDENGRTVMDWAADGRPPELVELIRSYAGRAG